MLRQDPGWNGPNGFRVVPSQTYNPKTRTSLFVNSPGLAERPNELLDVVFVEAPRVWDLLYVADRI